MTRDVDKSRIANATTEMKGHEEIEVTPKMIAAKKPQRGASRPIPIEINA
jgi:hypothetical protein